MNDSDKRAFSPSELPPLRVHYFLLWMAAVAVLMTSYGEAFRGNSEMPFGFYVDAFFQALSQALATATFCLGIYWWWRGSNFFDSVGHWLLSVIAISFLSGALFSLLVNHYLADWLNIFWSSNLNIAINLTEHLVPGVLLIVAGRKVADTVTWKRFCFIAGAGYIIFLVWAGCVFIVQVGVMNSGSLAESLVGALTFGFPILWFVLCALAIFEDLNSGIPRHWSHWCGVFLWMLALASRMAWVAYAYAVHNQ